MESELSIILNNVKKITGIDIDVYAETRKFFYSTSKEEKDIIPLTVQFEDIYSDLSANKTYFKIKFKNTKLIAVIDGATRTEYNYAALIMSLIESETNADRRMTKTDYLKALLNGDLNRTQVQKCISKFGFSDAPCYVTAIACPPKKEESITAFLENFGAGTDDISLSVGDSTCAYIRFCEVTDDYRSANDFAEVLGESIAEEIGIKVNIGIGNTVSGFKELPQSFSQAVAALRMSNLFGGGEGVHSYKEFLLVKMLEEIPKYKLNEYLDMLLDEGAKSVFSDAEMVRTGEEFLRNDLNVSETAVSLYLHRNTLMYRLDKIEKATGLNIRKFSDAVTFNLIVILLGSLK